MFKEGDVIQIGDNSYEIRHTDKNPCKSCSLKDCTDNEDFYRLRVELGILSCVDIIPPHTNFRVIEDDNNN